MKLNRIVQATALALSVITLNATEQTFPNLLELIEKSGSFAPMFPFQIAYDRPDNLTNVQTWAPAPLPAGVNGTVTPYQDVFIDSKHSHKTPLRFFGTNICFTGCFPSKEEADKVANTLAQFGFNAIRLHYVHHSLPPKGNYPVKDSFIEPVQLDRFDYLYAQLRKRGIYTYMQLNIGRKFGAWNGFENADKLPWYNNGLDNFEPRMVELHKRFVTEFLNHVNPYTNIAYKDDPAIANLEIANENSVLNAWFSKKYDLPNLPEPYGTLLQSLWNTFLQRKYGTTEQLKKAWHIERQSAFGPALIPEGILMGDVKNAPSSLWGLQQDKRSEGSWQILPAAKEDNLKGTHFARLNIKKIGLTPNIPQFYRTGFRFKKHQAYTLTFKIRTDKPASVSVRFSQDHNPWHPAGLRTTIKATPQWQTFTFPFGGAFDDENVRLVFADFTPGIIDIADISFHTGADGIWDNNASIEKQTVKVPQHNQWDLCGQRARDFTTFLFQLEDDYFGQLYDHIKKNVKPIQPVTGTQMNYGNRLAQAKMDYCDNHSYFNHPAFPAKSWDSSQWYLLNRSLPNGPVPGINVNFIANSRILGRPYTISEYDHPNTNLYCAEGNVILAATASFQNWAGIYQFAWTHNRQFERKVLSTMFDLCSATTKLAHLPACYAMFVRGDVKPSDQKLIFAIHADRKTETELVADKRAGNAIVTTKDRRTQMLPLALYSGTYVQELPHLYDLSDKKVVTSFEQLPPDIKSQFNARRVQNEHGELTWDYTKEKAGFFTVDTPNTKAFTGAVAGRSFAFKGMTLTPGKNRLDWLTLTLTNTTPPASPSSAKLAPGRYLLAATGLSHNTGAYYAKLPQEPRIAPAKFYGGTPGKAPILCEGVSATLTLNGIPARNVSCTALDANGNPKAKLDIAEQNGNAVVNLDPRFQTVWYQLDIR